MNNQECKIRPQITNINRNGHSFYLYSVKIDKCGGSCNNKRLISSPSNCDCECDKSCDVGEYLDYEKCKCSKKLIGKLADKCSEHIDENKMIYIDYENMCWSCTLYIVLLAIFFIISISITSFFIDFHWHLKSDTNITSINSRTETVIY